MAECIEARTRIEREPRGRIKHIGVDVDGTLIDSMAAFPDAFGGILEEYFSIPKDEAGIFFLSHIGKRTSMQVALCLSNYGIDVDPLDAEYIGSEINGKLATIEARPFPEVPEKLKKWKEEGYGIFASSSHFTHQLEEILRREGLSDFIDLALGRNPAKPSFTKGEAHFKAAASFFGIPYETFITQTAYCGDALTDMHAATSCGIAAIGRAGTRTEAELKEAGALMVVQNFSQIDLTVL